MFLLLGVATITTLVILFAQTVNTIIEIYIAMLTRGELPEIEINTEYVKYLIAINKKVFAPV